MIPIYVNDIRCSLKNKCYFSALSLALTLPDICGMAEFPDKSVTERYIEWYDKYLGEYMAQGRDDLGGDNPWLSGEVIYNLRNTYLHQGSPGIESDRIREEVNRLDKFTILLGDGTKLQEATFCMEGGTQETGKITFRNIIVDVTYLCSSICDCALWYYKNNQEKFKFNFNVITQEKWKNPSKEAEEGDFFAKILNQKFKKEGNPMRVVEEPGRNRRLLDWMRKDLDIIFSDKAMKQRFLSGKSIFTFTHPRKQSPAGLTETTKIDVKNRAQEKTESKENNTNNTQKKQSSKNVSREKREAQVRLFFDKYFTEKKYLDRKEVIIQAVLKSKTKMQINNKLMKHFAGKDVSTIYQRLKPIIKDLPGKQP